MLIYVHKNVFILIWSYNISPLTFQLYLECVDFDEDEFLFKDVTIDLYYTCYQLSLVFQYIDVEYDGDDVECFGNRLDRSAVIGVSAPHQLWIFYISTGNRSNICVLSDFSSSILCKTIDFRKSMFL